jgi:hypothetical protein
LNQKAKSDKNAFNREIKITSSNGWKKTAGKEIQILKKGGHPDKSIVFYLFSQVARKGYKEANALIAACYFCYTAFKIEKDNQIGILHAQRAVWKSNLKGIYWLGRFEMSYGSKSVAVDYFNFLSEQNDPAGQY